jgi:hypothetical protein
MQNRDLADHDLESLRRSLAMLQTNQLALTRDQGIDLVTQLLSVRRQVRQLDARLDAQHPGAADQITPPDGPRRA